MVKFYGVVFLGQPREARLAEAHDAGPWERTGLAWLAAGCVALGLAPATVIGMIDPITRVLTGYSIAQPRRRLAVPRADRAAARELQPVLFFLRRRACGGCSPGSRCASSTTAACGARRPGTAVFPGSTRACRTAPRASASR